MEAEPVSKDQEGRKESNVEPSGSPKEPESAKAAATATKSPPGETSAKSDEAKGTTPAATPAPKPTPPQATFPLRMREAPKPPRRSRRIVKAIVGLAVVAMAIVGWTWWRFDSRLQRVEPTAGTAFRWPYYLYVPASAEARAATGAPMHLLVLPNNTGKADDDFDVHERAAWTRARRESDLAEKLEVAALVPIFPRPAKDWQVYTHALDRDCLTTDVEGLVRLDLQLEAMIDDARRELGKKGWKVEEKVLIKGFSANGMFADRFTVLHPERVLAAAVGSPGGWPIAPMAVHDTVVLRYPAGVADVEELTGKPFDAEAFQKVPMLVFMGDEDTNDSLQFGDGWDDDDKQLVELVYGATPVERWEDSEAIHKAAGSKATFKLYPGVGHEVTGEMEADVEKFLGEALKSAQGSQ